MRFAQSFVAFGVLAAGASFASADQHVLTFAVSNPTAEAWSTVSFELRMPRGVAVSPEAFAAVQFVLDEQRHASSKVPYDLLLDESNMKKITFDYSLTSPITSSDGTVNFTVTVDNPFNAPFRIHLSKTVVPTPGAVALCGVGGLMMARRRRVA